MFAIVLLLSVLSLTYGFDVETNLARPAIKTLQNWTYVRFTDDHSNRQPNQPSDKWTNITFDIPVHATSVQFTTRTGVLFPAKAVPEEIPFYSISNLQNRIYVSLTWWGPPWVLGVGWNISRSQS